MRWWVFLPFAFLVAALDAALMPAFAVWGHVPHLVPVLLSFVLLYASRESAMGGALVLGLLADVASPALVAGVDGPSAAPILGPHMLAYAGAAWAVLEMRTWLYRRNTLTLSFTAAVVAVLVSLGFLAVAGVRAAYADDYPLWGGGRAITALGADLLDALWTAVLAVPAGWLLQRTLGLWAFATAGPRFAFDPRSARAGG